MKANNNQAFQRAQELAFRYSELAYTESCKPKAQRNQVLVDVSLQAANEFTNFLIGNGFWNRSIYPVVSEGFMGGRGNR